METFIVLCFSLCLVKGSQGQSTAMVSVASFSTTTSVTSSVAKLNVGSPSGEISTKSPRAASTLESSSAIINQVFPSASIDVSLPYVTDEAIVSMGTSIAASFTPAALHSAPQWVSLTQVTTALTSTADTVEPTIASTVKPTIIPSVNVDGCNNYTILSEADRAQGYIGNNYRGDYYDLAPGWYRFQGAAGDRMADKCVPIGYCGTYAPGWLNGTHPTVAEGVVTRKVCYHDHDYWKNNCCYLSNNITVRNCGAFFVYELSMTPCCYVRYCGNGSGVDGCNNYTVLSEADRAQEHIVINASNYRSDYNDLVPGWYRFQGAAGDRMADKCVPMDHCGTQSPGWLNGTHPTVAEGAVIRRVCFNISNNCCYWYQDIRVKNCGAYFVYALPTRYYYYYYYYFRYCGNGRAAYTCSALPAPSNGIKFGCPENATVYNDTVCQFSCNDGYIGSGSQARRCQHNETWSGQDFTCQVINCTSLMQIVDPGGPLRMSSCANHFGTQCNFSCPIGYHLNGSSTVTCVAPGNQHPGVWNNTIPTCEASTCSALPAPSNGIKFGCSENATVYNDTVCQFSCNDGYIGSGSQVRRCQHNGTWSGEDFTCQEILCEPLQLAPNLKMNTSCSRLPGDSCEFACERGYDLIGSSIRTCNSEGSWTGVQPRCEAVTCSKLSPPSNGELLGCNATQMIYSSVCTFSCNEGFEGKGSVVRTCTENGTWSGTDLVCTGTICLEKNFFTTDALESRIN